MKEKNPLKALIWLIVLVIVIFFGGKFYWNSLQSPADADGLTQVFVVKKGETASDVAQKLTDQKIIRSSFIFKYLYKNSHDDTQIQAGDYKLSPAMSTEEIIKQLSQGSLDKWVTLLEGWRDEEMAQKLSDELGVKSEEFLKVARQGYMFPDTYLFNPKATAQSIVSILRNNFDRKYDSALQARIKAHGLTSDQGIILASIVEREARSDEVRTKVASILLKRLKIGMGLNVDSTVQYALGYQSEEKSWWKRHLSAEDLKINSPYNTYLHAGLPPTPICNPSLSSLKAVANADSSIPYLYYYHDSKGNSYYAKTLDEHNQNVANHP